MFTIESQTCDFSESEFFEIFVEERFPYSLDDIDHTDVTTEIDGITKIMPSLTLIIIEITNRKFVDFYLASIFVHHIWFYLSCIETYRCRDSFKYTSWLVW